VYPSDRSRRSFSIEAGGMIAKVGLLSFYRFALQVCKPFSESFVTIHPSVSKNLGHTKVSTSNTQYSKFPNVTSVET
jgi:hypothetical protein